MINALKNLFREKVVSNSIEADEALAYDVERSRELERERAIQSKIDADAIFDRFYNAASIGDTFDYLGVQCVGTSFNVNDDSWLGKEYWSSILNYQYRDASGVITEGEFSSGSITLFEALMSKSKS